MYKAGSIFAKLIVIHFAWMLLAAGITLYPGNATTVLVPFPPKSLIGQLPEEVFILKWNANLAILTSERPAFVLDLYKQGAALVLPARKSGCIALRKNDNSGSQ